MQIQKEEIYQMIIQLCPIDLNENGTIGLDTDIITDLEFDSISIVELLERIEEKYGVDFTELPDFLERMETVGTIIDGVEKLIDDNINTASPYNYK